MKVTRYSMTLQDINLDGGAFKLNLPYNFVGWIIFVLGFIVVLVGFVLSVDDAMSLGISAAGFLVMAFSTPGSLEADLHNVRKNAIDPAELEAKAEASGLTIDNWWLQQTTYVPTTDPNDWILPAPGPSTWNNESPYVAD